MEYNFPLPKKLFETPEDEIIHLRNVLAEKEKALDKVGLKKEDLSVARQVLSEYKAMSSKKVLDESNKLEDGEIEKIVLKLYLI